MADLSPGDVVWVSPDSTVGREQSGRRPALVVAGDKYLATFADLALIVPLTSVARPWPNRVPVKCKGLKAQSWAITEQARAISRQRIRGKVGRASDRTLASVRVWLGDFLEL